jgi:V8-like Glu-specific endopeptidase/subtilisin-like proprotein convertase family protein
VSCQKIDDYEFKEGKVSLKSPVIYGDDNRVDLFRLNQIENHLSIQTKAVALLVDKAKISEINGEPDFIRLNSSTLHQESNICLSEPFAKQPVAGFCTGFLLDDDILVTAGHCIDNIDHCKKTLITFGFAYSTHLSDPTKIRKDDVYECSELILKERDRRTKVDFAIIRLNRLVKNRPHLNVNLYSPELNSGDKLTILGHPNGLPLKIAFGPDSEVRKNSPENLYFVATLDSYLGNSGSPVLNSTTGFLEGVLVRGEKDYEFSENECFISKKCSHNDCRGEDVMKINEVIPYIPKNYPAEENSVDIEFSKSLDSVPIPDLDPEGVLTVINVDEHGNLKDLALEIEGKHKYPVDISVEVGSPDGFTYTFKPKIEIEGAEFKLFLGFRNNLTYGVHRFWNRSINGEWTIRVVDELRTDEGVLSKVKLILRLNK